MAGVQRMLHPGFLWCRGWCAGGEGNGRWGWCRFNLPRNGGMAARTLATAVIIGPDVACFAVRIARVIKRHLGPIVGIVAAGTLAGPMAARRGMAGRAIVQIGVVYGDLLPVSGVVAI